MDVATLPPELADIAAHIGLGRTQRVIDALARRVGSVVAITESVRRRHNASAILRTCEVFGIHEVHLVTDGFRPSLGASRASERWIRLHAQPTTEAAFAELQPRGFKIFVADFTPDAYTPETVPMDGPIAVLFGSEFQGVSQWAKDHADGVIQIPMYGLTQSLNVSTSAAIILRALTERKRGQVGADLDPAEQMAFLTEWLWAQEAARRGVLARTEVDGYATLPEDE